jgi:hypothetical protein
MLRSSLFISNSSAPGLRASVEFPMRICDRLVPATPGEASSRPDGQTTFWPPSAANAIRGAQARLASRRARGFTGLAAPARGVWAGAMASPRQVKLRARKTPPFEPFAAGRVGASPIPRFGLCRPRRARRAHLRNSSRVPQRSRSLATSVRPMRRSKPGCGRGCTLRNGAGRSSTSAGRSLNKTEKDTGKPR